MRLRTIYFAAALCAACFGSFVMGYRAGYLKLLYDDDAIVMESRIAPSGIAREMNRWFR